MKVKTNDIESIRHINTIMVLKVTIHPPIKSSNRDLRKAANHIEFIGRVVDMFKCRGYISNIARELNEQSLTVDAGFGVPDSRGGRKPLLLDLDRAMRRVIGVRLGAASLELSLCDITGRELQVSRGLPQSHGNLFLISAMVKDLLLYTNTLKGSIFILNWGWIWIVWPCARASWMIFPANSGPAI